MKDRIFEAISEPNRRYILELLSVHEHTVGELVEKTGLSQPGVSKHLRVLRNAGLVQVRHEGQRHWYQLRAEPLAEIDAWLEPYRQFWTSRLDALEKSLDEEESKTLEATVQKINGGYVARFERHLKHPVNKVWEALTQPEKLSNWLADAKMELVKGGKIELTFSLTEGNVMVGKITEVEPQSVLEYTWGDDLIRWELYPENEGCLLVLKQIFSDLSEQISRELAGWHVHLNMLSQALEGHQAVFSYSHWEELCDSYSQLLNERDKLTE
jgi:DNA-binding transcriptional ArsR family regulator/uncharacterized protein YndB with AHSA1/START domain